MKKGKKLKGISMLLIMALISLQVVTPVYGMEMREISVEDGTNQNFTNMVSTASPVTNSAIVPSAEEGEITEISYLDWDDTAKQLVPTTKKNVQVTTVTSGAITWGEVGKESWYRAGAFDIEKSFTVQGTVHLVLEGTLNIHGITIKQGSKLIVHAKSVEDGIGINTISLRGNEDKKITVEAGSSIIINGAKIVTARIGNDNDNDNGDCGNITINEANVEATGIGSENGDCGNITINKGTIIITSTIGGEVVDGNEEIGASGACDTIAINNAVVTAKKITAKDTDIAKWTGIIFQEDQEGKVRIGKLYGTTVTLDTKFEMRASETLLIENGEELIIGKEGELSLPHLSSKLEVEGILNNNGTIKGSTSTGGTINVKGTLNNRGNGKEIKVLNITGELNNENMLILYKTEIIIEDAGELNNTGQIIIQNTTPPSSIDCKGTFDNSNGAIVKLSDIPLPEDIGGAIQTKESELKVQVLKDGNEVTNGEINYGDTITIQVTAKDPTQATGKQVSATATNKSSVLRSKASHLVVPSIPKPDKMNFYLGNDDEKFKLLKEDVECVVNADNTVTATLEVTLENEENDTFLMPEKRYAIGAFFGGTSGKDGLIFNQAGLGFTLQKANQPVIPKQEDITVTENSIILSNTKTWEKYICVENTNGTEPAKPETSTGDWKVGVGNGSTLTFEGLDSAKTYYIYTYIYENNEYCIESGVSEGVKVPIQEKLDQQNEQQVEQAKSAIEATDWTIEQATANTEEQVKQILVDKINEILVGLVESEPINVTADNINLASFTPAVEGTRSNTTGTNGSFAFTVALTKGNAAATTVSMGGTIKATAFVEDQGDKPSGGGSNGNSGGSSSIDQPSEPSEEKPIEKPEQSNEPTIGKINGVKPNKSGMAVISHTDVVKAIKTATKEAEENGTIENGIVLEIPILNKAKAKTLSIALKGKTVDKLIAGKVKYVTITTNAMPSYVISLKTLKQLDKQSKGGDIVIKIAKKTIPAKQKNAIKAVGKRPVYYITMTAVKGTKKTSLSSWNNNVITVRLPYTPAKKEIKANLHIANLSKKGNVKWIEKSKYSTKEKAVVFEMKKTGIYGVGYKK